MIIQSCINLKNKGMKEIECHIASENINQNKIIRMMTITKRTIVTTRMMMTTIMLIK